MEESFEIKVGAKITDEQLTESEDEGSEISDVDVDISIDDEDHVENHNFLIECFQNVAKVDTVAYREFKITFTDCNKVLIDDDEKYEFETNEDNIPILEDTSYFIPFVNQLKEKEPCLIGVTIYTNLEGGGSLII